MVSPGNRLKNGFLITLWDDRGVAGNRLEGSDMVDEGFPALIGERDSRAWVARVECLFSTNVADFL